MTTRHDVKKALRSQFISNFDQTVPVCFENRDDFWLCTSPLTATTKPSNSTWVRFYVMNNTSFQNTFAAKGNRNVRRNGLINFQVFIPPGQGTSAGEEIAEDIIDIFELEEIDNIWCHSGTYRESNIQDDGFYMLVGNISYDFDIRK